MFVRQAEGCYRACIAFFPFPDVEGHGPRHHRDRSGRYTNVCRCSIEALHFAYSAYSLAGGFEPLFDSRWRLWTDLHCSMEHMSGSCQQMKDENVGYHHWQDPETLGSPVPLLRYLSTRKVSKAGQRLSYLSANEATPVGQLGPNCSPPSSDRVTFVTCTQPCLRLARLRGFFPQRTLAIICWQCA